MKKRRVAMTISVPPDIAKEYDKLARQQVKNKSQLFRDMFTLYQTRALEEKFFELQREGVKLARQKGILTEEDVERIVFEGR